MYFPGRKERLKQNSFCSKYDYKWFYSNNAIEIQYNYFTYPPSRELFCNNFQTHTQIFDTVQLTIASKKKETPNRKKFVVRLGRLINFLSNRKKSKTVQRTPWERHLNDFIY
jgi:hypothetical protein